MAERAPVEQAMASPRIAIESVGPTVEHGRYPAKVLEGRAVTLSAVLICDGHGLLNAEILWCTEAEGDWQSLPMTHLGNDQWQAELIPQRSGMLHFVVQVWMDGWATYCDELAKKHQAGVPVDLELLEGQRLIQDALDQAAPEHIDMLQELLVELAQPGGVDAHVALLLQADTAHIMALAGDRPHLCRSARYRLDVERQLAEFASWYELFPRSESGDAQRHGTFDDVIKRLPQIRHMGFDVLYFPPIHPIGLTHRKGPNNSLKAGPDDPGSPYAIGSEEGGHDAVHPLLGSLDDFRRLVAEARAQQLEIALDFAIQCSPDHPWLREHPGWFNWRPDGSIRYAENPPKKYEDIVNVEFYNEQAMPELWLALRDVVLFWVKQGVTLFRVDNPHTKPLPFWEWLIAEVRQRHPEVIFLAEAFTRPAMMARLGKIGFSQSYSYFTWRNTKAELQSYFAELNQSPWRECYRPNFFVNTPDINPRFLHNSGRAGFLIRAALATMGSGLWGMYSGFEICESQPVPGREEYLDSEKYQLRPRNWNAPGNIIAEIAQLNRIRRDNPALQTHLGFQAYHAWNDNILYFGKRTEDLSNFILVAVSLDPFNVQQTHFELPLWELGLNDDASTQGEDLMNGHSWLWHGKTQWMRIEPWHLPFGIWRIRPMA